MNNQQTLLRFVTLLMLVGLGSLVGCGSSSQANVTQPVVEEELTPPEPPPQRDAIAILFTDDDSAYGKSFVDGAKTAATEKSVEIEWFNVAAGDVDGQKKILDDVIAQRFRGMCVSPQKIDVLIDSLDVAKKDETSIVIFEKPLSLDPTSDQAKFNFASTDHFRCGQLVAEHIQSAIDDGIVLIVEDNTLPSSSDRRYGVEFGLKQSKIQVVSTVDLNKPADGEESPSPLGLEEALKLFSAKFTETKSDVAAEDADDDEEEDAEDDETTEPLTMIVVATDAATSQNLVALKEKYPDWKLYGSGSWDGIEDQIKDETLAATILEDPFLMGLSTIMTAADAMAGKEGNGLITTGEYLVTAENLDDERMASLLKVNHRD